MSGMFEVAIIGAGFSGLGAAIKLREKGIENIVILERSDRVGGTWRDNRYPGAACDIPSALYSFSFAPKGKWSRMYAGSNEILDYIEGLVDHYGLAPLIRYNHTVSEMTFEESAQRWHLETAEGRAIVARNVVVASGPFAGAKIPDFDGLEHYKGHVIHSADWDHEYDFRGKRVAVIGTGASGVQIIPELVKKAERVVVFQRTPGWVLPKRNPANPDRILRPILFWAHEAMATGVVWTSPVTGLLERRAKAYMKKTVLDPWLRRQLTPEYRIGCKRVLMSSDYYPALNAKNCKLVTWPIVRFGERGIVTAAALEYEADCVVFATGFDVGHYGLPYKVNGADGRDLATEWQKTGAQAYKSVSIEGFPNLFMTFGPNSGPGHNSALVYVEAQLDYIARAIAAMRHKGIASLDVKPDRQKAYNEEIQKRLAGTNWNSGCQSWYLNENGFNATMYPGFATQFQRELGRFSLQDYDVKGTGSPQPD